MLSIIVAVDENNAIGKENQLLCYLPNDLKYFKSVTQGRTVIMGRKTYESLPNGALPNRRNIVISRNSEFKALGCEVVSSLVQAIGLCDGDDEAFIMGGGMLYNEAIKVVDRLYVTHIHHRFDGADTFFSFIDPKLWRQISCVDNDVDDRNKYSYSFVLYERL